MQKTLFLLLLHAYGGISHTRRGFGSQTVFLVKVWLLDLTPEFLAGAIKNRSRAGDTIGSKFIPGYFLSSVAFESVFRILYTDLHDFAECSRCVDA